MYYKNPTPRPILTEKDAAALRDKAIDQALALYEKRLLEIKHARMGRREKPSPTERTERAWKLRQAGKTYKAIGQALGISGGRASQLVKKYERFKELEEANDPRSQLSVRAYNCLRNHGLDPSDPESVSKASGQKLSRTPNMGKKTFAEIIVWLQSKGHELAP